MSLLLSACGTNNNTTNVPSNPGGGTAPAVPAPAPTGDVLPVSTEPEGAAVPAATSAPGEDTTSTSVSVPPVTTKTPAKELEITKGSVVYSKKHVIVNAANANIADGGGSTGAIFAAAGKTLLEGEIRRTFTKGRLATSEVFTTGAHNLSSQGTQYIIHALGPIFESSNFEPGYTALRQTYKNLYTEMDRLNRERGVTTIGVIPISAGIYAGSASKTRMYEIMVDETLSAMKTYPALQPELYLFSRGEYDAVKPILQSAVAKMAMPAALSASVARASTLTLMEAPVHTLKMGTLNFQGAATSLGFLRIMGGVVESVNESLTQLSVGKMNGSSFVGCEFETAYLQQEHAHFSVKATGAIQISDGLKLAGGIGYIRENIEASLSRNVRNFLNLESKDYERNGVTCDVIAQHQLSLSSTVSFTTNVGITAKYTGKAVISPFLQVSCNIEGLGVAAVISQQEFGFNFHHSQ